MGRKIFVACEHSDSGVQELDRRPSNGLYTTARDYVDCLIDKFEGDEIYTGEDDENPSQFNDQTIEAQLMDKIYDSSITLVLISRGMKEEGARESDQRAPWEISHSLREITKNGKTSPINAVLAVVLPDWDGDYSYYITDCEHNCGNRELATHELFQILRDNMFNHTATYRHKCPKCGFVGRGSSYIDSVKWCDFLNDTEFHMQKAIRARGNHKSYNITDEVKDER